MDQIEEVEKERKMFTSGSNKKPLTHIRANASRLNCLSRLEKPKNERERTHVKIIKSTKSA